VAGRSRATLWADVVRNLALLTVLTIALNAVLLGKVSQGREAALRADLAGELCRVLAARAGLVALEEGAPDSADPRPWQAAFDAVQVPEGEPFFAVLVGRDLRPVVSVGAWPPELDVDDEAARAAWLLDAVDLRAAMSARRTERAQWQPRPSFFRGRVYETVTTPVLGEGSRPVGAVRVVVPVGSPLFGPADRQSLPVLGLSTILSAILVGAFGYFLVRRRILVPVEALVDGARDVGEGRFDTRLPDGAADELGVLASAFNEMAAALERYRRTNEGQLDELRAINEDLSQAREDLIFAEKMATVGRLAAGVAHEVGNPLASVIGFVELLQSDAELADDFLPRIRTELDRIHRIIRDLLDYSRPTGMTQNDLRPVVAPSVQVLGVVEAAVHLVSAQPRFADVSFDVQLTDDLGRVRVPPDRLQQILLNLFVNAAEAMEGRGVIRVYPVDDAGADGEGMVVIGVEDDGPGIDPRAGSNIYEPFFTTKDVGAGTGLGLAVSLRLVEKMGGRLRHQRDNAGGACFHLALPAEEA
jgi:two-component system, NtrC family, sensor kinase